jgi:hypothetical protein
MAAMIASGEFDVVLGSRILGKGALSGGMPFYKYVSNRFLMLMQNLMLGEKLSEYHTGFRAFSKEVLSNLPLEESSSINFRRSATCGLGVLRTSLQFLLAGANVRE